MVSIISFKLREGGAGETYGFPAAKVLDIYKVSTIKSLPTKCTRPINIKPGNSDFTTKPENLPPRSAPIR
jgi:hypothetical protein